MLIERDDSESKHVGGLAAHRSRRTMFLASFRLKIAQPFNAGMRIQNAAESRLGRKKRGCYSRGVFRPCRDSTRFVQRFPALKRWAIFLRLLRDWHYRFTMWSARFSTFIAASLTASLSVGCE